MTLPVSSHSEPAAASGSSDSILTINGGSSSIRFALFSDAGDLTCRLDGKVDRIGSASATLQFDDHRSGRKGTQAVAAKDLAGAAKALTDWLASSGALGAVTAIGHRVVHGMGRAEPALIDADLLSQLHGIEVADPDHLPGEIELIEIFRGMYPDRPQIACFDTAFHHDMPRVAALLPIPRRYEALGLRRYGFHGLSYAYLVEELARVAGAEAARARVVMAHLGNGASLAALRDGQSVDTSMGFTPAAGVPMGTRSGDLDPGLAAYLQRTEQMTTEAFSNMINRESGLIGLSEISADMRDLLASEATDVRAAEAVAVFCYQVRKWIGAYAAALGGLDTLVFSGGIGEGAAIVRERICDGLGFLGIELERSRNDAHADVISRDGGRVAVRVIPTNEQLMIARSVRDVIGRREIAMPHK
jgi:acetate kinase